MCRDPFGIKPLFVLSKDDEIVVCSEIGPLVSRLGRLVYNDRNISHILRWGCDDGFEETFAQHIARIRPGTCRSLDLTTLEFGDEFRYFDIDAISERDWSFGEAKIALRDTFVSSVDHHMRSDAELGFALSGGIDSSAIVCAARELGRSPIRTFSYIAHEEKISELKWVELVVKRVGADATLVRPTTNDLERNLPWVAGHQGEPFGSLSIFAQNEVYRKVAERGVKVILSGQGADELLAGYLNFLLSFVASEIRRGRFLSAQTLLRTMRQRFNMSLATSARWLARQMLPEQLKERVAARYLKRKAPWLNVREIVASGVVSLVDINPDTAARSRLKQTMKFAIKDTLVALLRYDDRNSMSHSVESRVPFLTPKMATICLSLPDQFLISSKGVSKHIFREAMRGIVPDRILDRNDKVNFAPDNRAWRAAITNLCSEDEPHLELRRIIDTHKLRLALEKPAEEGEPVEMLWRAVNVLMMDRQYRLANQT
jgi:asparagine synthase (glutamine-hydrolysing)